MKKIFRAILVLILIIIDLYLYVNAVDAGFVNINYAKAAFFASAATYVSLALYVIKWEAKIEKEKEEKKKEE